MARFALLGRTIDGIFTPSVDLREQVIPGGAPTRKVHTIPNGLDIERFSLLSADERAAAREALDMPQDATVLLHFGWDWHRKGGDLFLDTVRRLLDDARWRHRTLLAVTSQGGEPARRLAAQLGLSDHVRTVGPIDDVETLHAAADILLATSRAEGGMPPLAVAEALSRGTPVVATEIPDHIYAAEATPACRVVPHDPAAIAKAVVEMPRQLRAVR
jgi:glycosyltransferase involved in cell wall biosynthesis